MNRTVLSFAILASLLVCGEFAARYWLGLGTPPLSISHPRIEYMFAPNQDLRRFGNHHYYNEYGVRSISIETVTQQSRMLVFGDSVLNGGNLTDQSALATEIASDSDVFFGNVSAGSWGPANMTAWIDEYGLLNADAVIVVISSHDLQDAPDFAPLDRQTHPTERPFSALMEGVQRYLPRYLPSVLSGNKGNKSPEIDQPKVSTAGSIQEFIERTAASETRLCAIQHKEKSELDIPPTEESKAIRSIFESKGVPVLDFGTALRTTNQDPYRDTIHINDHGQELLAGYLWECSVLARVPRM